MYPACINYNYLKEVMMQKDTAFTAQDRLNMEAFLNHVLDEYKNGKLPKDKAVSGIAHVITAVEAGDYSEARAWFMQGRALIRQ